jgi:hypothetical protein
MKNQENEDSIDIQSWKDEQISDYLKEKLES